MKYSYLETRPHRVNKSFIIYKRYKMAEPILESSGPNTIYCEFLIAKKSLTNFSCA